MSEKSKTLSFVATAGFTLLLAVITYFQTQPKESTGFENVGKEFFADFQGSQQASSLEVRAVDKESATLKEFRVEEKDGLWTIPSHFGYPAEATERLAETSSSLIGLKREALVGRLASEHERFGVLDPLDEDNLDPESTGKRITIKDDSDEILVDLIIGKEAEETQPTDMQQAMAGGIETKSYYVRHPDELQTFKVKMDLELSTRFSDWINPDLLDLESADVRRIDIDNYELNNQANPLAGFDDLFKNREQMEFTRDTGFGPWTMAGLDAEKKDLDSTKMNNALRTLDNLKIAGVREKMTYQGKQLLTADLKVVENETLTSNPQLFNQVMLQMQQELADYGFNLTRDPNTREVVCVAESGEIAVGRENGVVYTMQFGKAVSGDEDEIEIGISSAETDADEKDPGSGDPEEGEDSKNTDTDPDENKADKAEEIKNRYLMIRVSFDQSLLGDKPEAPIEPVEPTKPEGYVAAPETNSADESDDAPKPSSDESKDETQETGDEQEKVAPVDDRPQEFKDYDLNLATFKQKKTEYELKLSQFEDQKKEFESKVADGEKLVGDLNERFGKWFYVISGDNLESIQMKRDDLVTDKPNPEGEAAEEGLPNRPNINFDQPDSATNEGDPSGGTEAEPANTSGGSDSSENVDKTKESVPDESGNTGEAANNSEKPADKTDGDGEDSDSESESGGDENTNNEDEESESGQSSESGNADPSNTNDG